MRAARIRGPQREDLATKFPTLSVHPLGRITRATYRVTKTYIAGKRLDFPDRRLAPTKKKPPGKEDRFYMYMYNIYICVCVCVCMRVYVTDTGWPNRSNADAAKIQRRLTKQRFVSPTKRRQTTSIDASSSLGTLLI